MAKRIEKLLVQKNKEIQAVNVLARSVSDSFSISHLISSAYEQIRSAAAPDMAVVYLIEGGRLISQGEQPENPVFQENSPQTKRIGQCLCGLAAQGNPIYSQDIHADPRCIFTECKQAGIRSFAALPLKSGDKTWGVLGVGSLIRRDFSEQSDFLETAASLLGMALKNAGLREEMEDYAARLFRQIEEQKQIDAALVRERDLITRFMETSPAGVTVVDAKGRIIFANRRAEQVLGLTRNKITIRDYNDPEWRITDCEGTPLPDAQLPFNQVMDIRKPVFDVQHGIEWPDGRRVILSVNAAPLFNETGQIDGMVASVEDITEKKQIAEELTRSRALLLAAIEQCPAGIIIADAPNVRIRIANSAALGIRGGSERPLMDIPVELHPENWQIFHPDGSPFKPKDLPLSQAILFGKTVKNVDTIIRRPNGEERWLIANAAPVKNTRGDIIAGVVVFPDVTEQKQAEESLRESENRYRSFVQNFQGITFRGSLDFVPVFFHGAVEKITGYTEKEFVSRNPRWDQIIHPDDLHDLKKGFQSIRTSPDFACEREYRIFRKDGQIRWVKEFIQNLSNDAGQPIAVQGIIFDITDAKSADAEKKRLESQLQQALRLESIATLAGGIAHQFNNALAIIVGNLDLMDILLQDKEKLNEFAKPMRASVQRMTQLTDQLLAYARGGKYYPEPICLSSFVKQTLPIIKHAVTPEVIIETRLSPDTLRVEADLTQMQMVLSAALRNASEAMNGKGRIRVSTQKKRADELFSQKRPGLKPGDYAVLTVEDEGPGMDEDTRARVFDPFFTTKFQGRGLGMAAAYGIVKSHYGWIGVNSEKGRGTRVDIYLPTLYDPVEKKETPEIKSPDAPKTVLLIEDDPMILDISRQLLERLGNRVIQAPTGAEAVRLAETFEGDIHLALLDIILPDMNGKDVYPRITALRPGMKVVVCSGYSLDGTAQDILNAGAQGFLQKPFSLQELSAKVKNILT